MTIIKADARIRIKSSSITGATPSVGTSSNHTDGTWGVNDIYTSEFFLNRTDDELSLATDNGVFNIPLFPIGGIPSYLGDAEAGVAGLTAGDFYQTSGGGTPSTAGILMIKQ